MVVEETVAAVATITGSALRNAASLPTTARRMIKRRRRRRRLFGNVAGRQVTPRGWPVHNRSAGTTTPAVDPRGVGTGVRGGEGLAGAEEIPIQFLHKANASPPRDRGTPQPHRCPTTGRGPVYIIYFIRYYSVFFFFFNWNDHHPLAGVTKLRVLETYLSQTIDQGH